MALNIKSAHAEKVVRELARLTGESVTEAVTKAAEARLESVKAERERLFVQDEVFVRDLQAQVRESLGGEATPITKAHFDELWGENAESDARPRRR